MTKYFLLFALVLFVWWLWRKSASTRSTTRRPTAGHEPERMVQCARCGVNQPVSESILANDRYYCCPAHLREARSEGG